MNGLMKGLLVTGGLALAATLAADALVDRSRWFSYRGKRIIVTGGSRGLGLVIARQLLDAGARVAICARTEEDLEVAEQELRRRGGEVISIPCDIRDQGQVHAMVQRVVDDWGGVDVLFNVAGIIQVGPLDSMTLEDFHEAMDINCWGPLHTTLAVLPYMRSHRWGRIVNIASIGGKQAIPHLIPYVTSKFALVGLSNGLRTELAKDGIVVTTVCPGLMRTGSPRGAEFKGKHREEYTWFSVGDALPIVSMDAGKAARQTLTACQRGDAEVILFNRSNLGILFQQLAPEWTTEIFSLINRLLPEMGGIGRQAARGYQSQTQWSPSWLTQLGERAAVQNNELGPRPNP